MPRAGASALALQSEVMPGAKRSTRIAQAAAKQAAQAEVIHLKNGEKKRLKREAERHQQAHQPRDKEQTARILGDNYLTDTASPAAPFPTAPATSSAKLLRAKKRIIDFKVNFHDSLQKQSCAIQRQAQQPFDNSTKESSFVSGLRLSTVSTKTGICFGHLACVAANFTRQFVFRPFLLSKVGLRR